MGDLSNSTDDVTFDRQNFCKKSKKVGDCAIFYLKWNTKKVPIIYEKPIMIIKSIKFRNKTL